MPSSDFLRMGDQSAGNPSGKGFEQKAKIPSGTIGGWQKNFVARGSAICLA